jgi:putative peptide zinc metalloprotease protein
MRYPSEQTVIVEPLARQPDPDGFLIGRRDLGAFVLLPADAVEVLDDLAAGKTVGEAQALYHGRHGETPEMEEFLTSLEGRGFVRPATGQREEVKRSEPKSFHFEWISPRWAARMASRPVLIVCALLVALAVAAVCADRSNLPGWRAAYFPNKTAAGLLFLMFLGIFTTFIHEMAHLVAARARGVSCRFGIGNQLWFVVWETDMTGIWALPRRQRYLPILAGPLADLVTASILVILSFLNGRGWLPLAPRALQLGRALLFVYLMRIAWQCYFFLRTDFYYAMANLLGCKNLMQDTQLFLRNAAARLFRIGRTVDQSHIPVFERGMVRIYSGIWLAGRVLAFSLLIFVQLPLFFSYGALAVRKLRGVAPSSGDGEGAVTLLTGLFFSLFLLAGFALWLKRLWPKKGPSV